MRRTCMEIGTFHNAGIVLSEYLSLISSPCLNSGGLLGTAGARQNVGLGKDKAGVDFQLRATWL